MTGVRSGTRRSARRWWWTVHKWGGLLLAAVFALIGLSGTTLVIEDGLDRLIHPRRYAVTGEGHQSYARYLATARTVAQPGERAANIVRSVGTGPLTVTLVSRSAGAARRLVYLDPATARVLDVATPAGGVMRLVHRLHGSLLVPVIGRTIVGWVGLALALSCLSGLVLWWPRSGGVRRALSWRRGAGVAANLHRLAGAGIALPLLVLALTGAWISFPNVAAALSGEDRTRGAARLAGMLAPPLARPALKIDAVVARARPLAPAAPLRTIILPTERSADWTLAYDTQPMLTVAVADDSGVAARGLVLGSVAGDSSVGQIVRRVHDGTGMGRVWNGVIALAGLAPTLFGITGVALWWRRRVTRDASRPA
ncbi:PepSY domain-containing protein [Sphingomonas sp. NBWT7]|uniref:PepSY-associated TM helix domain-containing protein n=1 Tax=Sphingomonas sp. NBWT7 TaxID=2596913 RepID=UPI001623EAE7|nr:PepSY-associated TM helix domain-containing protein [Sphingomonas sp. NBWT7]QNE32770.1 PepSY domain-containing protein [Sphingomonas sp. NBWT7]